MKKMIGLLLILTVVLPFSLFSSGDTLTAQMKKFEPFIGQWKTRSIYPGKNLEVPGDIEYRRVLGKNWLFIEFVGQHPERDSWEAHVMIKFDITKNRYAAYVFFTADDPILMTGSWISDKTFRLETKNQEGESVGGIDYTVKTDGTVYQENWQINDNNQKKITLKTYYTRK